MKDVTLDRTTVLQLDADGTNGALDPAADCHVLRNDASLDLCAVADEKIRGAQLPFDSTEDLRWTVAFDVPTIDIPAPMLERVAAFVVGPGLAGGCATTAGCCCTALPTASAQFAAAS